ncbi:zinc finger C-x8-C-x5-C-x3-H type family protein [Actinidia rufa]|uniref:Zinc finger C-x8-C-x5-C-x3-H type family protein n=1 Tax=Actinidia rufa TaxID=165716 RepID=A0A7J0FL21_9ERIC|nr:zinc finger C-x8-C-x5-C-x3-H type family protein [Actinidia rufa]
MPDNHQVQSNGGVSNSSDQSVDNLEEDIMRMEIQTNDNQGSGVVGNCCPYPDRPGEPDCMYYLRTGLCGYGSKCKFHHPNSAGNGGRYSGELPERVGQPDCVFYLKTGTCKYGSACKYHHPRDKSCGKPAPLNILGLPMRQDENPCPFYMRTGLCKFGVACKFHHPQPAGAGTAFPIPGPTAHGPSSSSFVPPSGLHFVGVSALSLPRASYLPSSHVQVPQTYMPVVMSPSQSLAPTHGWNTYLEYMIPVSSSSVLGSDLVYNFQNQGESGSSGLMPWSPTSNPHLPERPDQPECRHFMSTGICKYGSHCKYHHPRERIAQLTTSSLGPLGLPLRPGQPVCSYYSFYGLCRYGPTCKYDHPFAGYSYNYGSSLPTLSPFDASFFPYQRNPPTVPSLETSPTKPPKVTDWVRKPEATSNHHQNPDIETLENPSEQASSPPNDQSD